MVGRMNESGGEFETHSRARTETDPDAVDAPAVARDVAVAVRDDLDFGPARRRSRRLAVPEGVAGRVAFTSLCGKLALREDALLPEAAVGLGRAIALKSLADAKALAGRRDVDFGRVGLLKRDVHEDPAGVQALA